MVNLDNLEEIKALDPKDVLGSTEMFASQCKQIWQDAKSVEMPADYSKISNIVFCGMGGSAYGGYVISNLFKEELKVPVISVNDYTLPGFVDERTLVVLLSYSGSTEEVLSCFDKAQKIGAKTIGLTTGGSLARLLEENDAPFLLFDPKFNPSGQPRLATGYMVLGVIALLNKAGIIKVEDADVEKAISELEASHEDTKAQSKALAQKIMGNIPVIFGAEFLLGNIHILRNQFNETAKSFSAFSPLPELNHHLMEGLKNPTDKKLITLFIDSDFYSDKLKKRFTLTQDVVKQNNITVEVYKPSSSSKLGQVLNVLAFGGFLTLFLAFLYNQDPSVIPWVDYFKKQLEQP